MWTALALAALSWLALVSDAAAAKPAPVVRAAPPLAEVVSLRLEPAQATKSVSSAPAKAPAKPALEAVPVPSPTATPDAEADAASGEPCASAAAGSELWLVSTRRLPTGVDCCTPTFEPDVLRFVCGRGYVPATLTELIADEDPVRPTIIFVHGNGNDADDSAETALDLYNQLLCSRCAVPIRLIAWSWPSEEVVNCPRKDARIKACRTNTEGYFLATFVDLLPAHTRVGLCGYSYGARVVTGSLHILGGGVLEGRQLAEPKHPDRDPARCVLLAAAMNNDWLLPGMRHERAVSQVERMVITISRVDPVLHFYPYLWGCGGPDALGVTGLVSPGRLGPDAAKIAHVDVTRAVHRRHGWKNFADSPEVMSLLRHELMHWPAAVVASR
jgi:predicted esterase